MHEKLALYKQRVADQFNSRNFRKVGAIALMGTVLSVAACVPAEVQFPQRNHTPAPTPIDTPESQAEIIPVTIRNTAKPTTTPTPLSDYEKLKEKGCPNTTTSIRNNHPEKMGLILDMCFGGVRIAVDYTSFYTNPKVKEAIAAAQNIGLKVIAVLNPHQLDPLVLPGGQVKKPEQQIRDLLTLFPNVDLEIGNEPDNSIIPFWKGEDLESFAKYFKKVYKEAIIINPDINIIVPSMVDVAKTIRLMQLITSYDKNDPEDVKVDLSRLKIAVHVYNEVQDIKDKLGFLKQHFKLGSVTYNDIKDRIVFTEIGVEGPERESLVRMLSYIRGEDEKMYHNEFSVHELVNAQNQGVTNHIYNSLDKRKSDPLKNWSITDIQRFPQHGRLPSNDKRVKNNPRRLIKKRFEHRKAE